MKHINLKLVTKLVLLSTRIFLENVRPKNISGEIFVTGSVLKINPWKKSIISFYEEQQGVQNTIKKLDY